MKSVHAQLLERIDVRFGHPHSKPTLFVPITGTNGSTWTVPTVTLWCTLRVSSINFWSHGLGTFHQWWQNVKKTLRYVTYDNDRYALLKNVAKHHVSTSASYLRFQLLRGGAD